MVKPAIGVEVDYFGSIINSVALNGFLKPRGFGKVFRNAVKDTFIWLQTKMADLFKMAGILSSIILSSMDSTENENVQESPIAKM
jgi:hypothetical protein